MSQTIIVTITSPSANEERAITHQLEQLIGQASDIALSDAVDGSEVTLKVNPEPSYDALQQVAEMAEAVIDSDLGGWSVVQLVVALRDAGIADYTADYAEDIATLAGEAPRD